MFKRWKSYKKCGASRLSSRLAARFFFSPWRIVPAKRHEYSAELSLVALRVTKASQETTSYLPLAWHTSKCN